MKSMQAFSTLQVSQLAGVSLATLERWLKSGRLEEPARYGDRRLWTPADIVRVKEYAMKHGGRWPRVKPDSIQNRKEKP